MAKAVRKGKKPTLVLVQMLVHSKPDVPDPEKEDALSKLQGLGYTQVAGVKRAKFFQLKFSGLTENEAWEKAEKIGAELLANPVTEVFKILNIEKIKQSRG